MELEIYNKDLEAFPLSRNFRLNVDGTAFTKTLVDYYARPGAYVTGDRSAGAPLVTLTYDTLSTDDQTFLKESSDLLVFLLAEKTPYYLKITPDVGPFPPLRYLVDYKAFKNKMKPGMELRGHPRSMTFWALDAFPESDAETIVGPEILSDEGFIEANNLGQGDAYPVIDVVAVDNLSNFTLSNEAAEIHTTVSDNSFTAGKRYRIDWITGEIRLFGLGDPTGILRDSAVTDGGPWPVKRDYNKIIYTSTSGQASVQITFRPVWYLF